MNSTNQINGTIRSNEKNSTIPECLSPQFDWMNNKYGQTPCQVVQQLISICPGAPYNITSLDAYRDIDHYPPPNKNQSNPCLCSMPVYNLVSACAGCQQSITSPKSTYWTYWNTNCEQSYTTFPFTIPSDTAIPRWASIDNSEGSTNLGLAFYDVAFQQSNAPPPASAFATPTATSEIEVTMTKTVIQSTATIVVSTPNSNELVPVKAIAGSAVGGLLFLFSLIGLYIFYRNKHGRIQLKGDKLQSSEDLPGSEIIEKYNSFIPSDGLFSTRGQSYTNSSSSASMRSRNRLSSYLGTEDFTTDSEDQSSFTTSSTESTLSLNFPYESPFSDFHQPSNHSAAQISPTNNLQNLIRLSVTSLPLSERSRVTLAPSLASSTGAVYGRNFGEESREEFSCSDTD